MIYRNEKLGNTAFTCDMCGVISTEDGLSGVIPSGWMSGHLWLDVSLSEQRQIPLCFCPNCMGAMSEAATVQISATSAVSAG
nr:hypothetical protein [uncultured Celeribacter sp.]